MDQIDLRSDTVTLPTPAMREAILNAKLGDDGYGEDPTVKRLEEMAAHICGKEEAILVTSGVQGNQVAALSWVGKGDEVICEENAHIYNTETSAVAALAGAQIRPVRGTRGIMRPEDIEAAIRDNKIHLPRTGLISVENTHNFAGGTCYSVLEMENIRRVAERYGIPIHLDGARIFNAAIAQNNSVAELVKDADSVQFCLSKGLCAPIGSLLVGSREFIARARRYRRILGGSMRQAGIIAAAGIVALETMVHRLEEDHRHARQLAEKIATTRLNIDLSTVQTNIVIFGTEQLTINAPTLANMMTEKGVKVSAINNKQVRMVTHYGITQADIDKTLVILDEVLQEIDRQ